MTHDDENGQKNHGAKRDKRDGLPAPAGPFPRMTHDHGIRCSYAGIGLAVLEGPEVVESQFPEAVMAAADMLRGVRAGQASEATTHGYDTSRSFLEELG